MAIARAHPELDGCAYELIDTPGMYSLMRITAEEQGARGAVLNQKPDALLHIVDAKSLERMLPLALQLVEVGVPGGFPQPTHHDGPANGGFGNSQLGGFDLEPIPKPRHGGNVILSTAKNLASADTTRCFVALSMTENSSGIGS